VVTGEFVVLRKYDEYVLCTCWEAVREVEPSDPAQPVPADDLSIRTGLTSVGNTSFIVRQDVRNQRGAVVCDASIVYVTVSADGKPIPVPDQWRTLFAPWEDGERANTKESR